MEKNQLKVFKQEMKDELQSILNFWMENTIDAVNGGFYGRIDVNNVAYPSAPKGVVLNCRILWTFSASYRFTSNAALLPIATRAFNYITNYFIDHEYGGLYWTVAADGRKLEDKKQVYGIAFCIYALAEYFKATGNKDALSLACELFRIIEKHSYDTNLGGYFEAFTRNWQPIDDLRLSNKDANEKKTMNTHLHVVEAYSNLYAVWPDGLLGERLKGILLNFREYIINRDTFHLNLFLDENWQVKSTDVSYGHDIEASWLLLESAEILGNRELIDEMKINAVKMSLAAQEGLDADGSMYYETVDGNRHLVKERHWWVQAEAVVGFFNAWQMDNNARYLDISLGCWEFIKNHLLDKQKGEWFWGVNDDYSVMVNQDKAGIWKCPYHNARMCLEILKRTSNL